MIISSAEDDEPELGATAKFKMATANTPEKRAQVKTKNQKEMIKAANAVEKKRAKNAVDASKKKEIAKADKLAKTMEKQLKKEEMIKVQQDAVAAQRALQKAAAKVCGLEPVKKRGPGRPPKNLAAAMAAADAEADKSAKKVNDPIPYCHCHTNAKHPFPLVIGKLMQLANSCNLLVLSVPPVTIILTQPIDMLHPPCHGHTNSNNQFASFALLLSHSQNLSVLSIPLVNVALFIPLLLSHSN